MHDIVAQTFQESFSPYRPPISLSFIPLLENFHDVPDKAEAKSRRDEIELGESVP